MLRYLIVITLSCLCVFTYAETPDVVKNNTELKALGNTLANYDKCKSLATQSGDKVMAYYYDEMHRLAMTEAKLESEVDKQAHIIKGEYDKASSILNRINSTGLYQLCLNRFDSVSRQYYTSKLEKA